jgi:hypothetical protein
MFLSQNPCSADQITLGHFHTNAGIDSIDLVLGVGKTRLLMTLVIYILSKPCYHAFQGPGTNRVERWKQLVRTEIERQGSDARVIVQASQTRQQKCNLHRTILTADSADYSGVINKAILS